MVGLGYQDLWGDRSGHKSDRTRNGREVAVTRPSMKCVEALEGLCSI